MVYSNQLPISENSLVSHLKQLKVVVCDIHVKVMQTWAACVKSSRICILHKKPPNELIPIRDVVVPFTANGIG